MTAVRLALVALVVAFPAWGQTGPGQPGQMPPSQQPPLQQQWQREGSPPVQQGPVYQAAPGAGGQSAQAPGQPPGQPSGNTSPGAAPGEAPPQVMERPNVWLPAGEAKLQALDKVNAQASSLTIKVGQSGTFGSLTIAVKACMIRPSDQAADAAAYLDVTNSHPDSPSFNGWILRDEPAVSMMQDPIYDIRVTGCA